jgi:general stress protein YciG
MIMTQQKKSTTDKKGTTAKRGFASMDEEKQREIASKGGHAAHEKGSAHEFTPEEAKEAGHKGGKK